MPNPPCGVQRKSRLTPAEIKYSGTNSKVYTADRAGESISQSQVDGTDSKDSILAKLALERTYSCNHLWLFVCCVFVCM